MYFVEVNNCYENLECIADAGLNSTQEEVVNPLIIL